ncbi:MAG: DUF819 family protein [Acidobacteriota bacterium]
MQTPLFILAVLGGCIVISELLARHTPLRPLGTALLVIVVTAIVANLGIIPTGSQPVPLYGVLFHEVAWMAIFWLLLEVNLKKVLRAGRDMIVLYLTGSLGVALGAFVGMLAIGGTARLGDKAPVLAGMFTGTYTGGSVNFMAIASQYEFTEGPLLLAANAVDAAMTTVWMAITVVVPTWWIARRSNSGAQTTAAASAEEDGDRQAIHPMDLSLLLLLGGLAVWGSEEIAARLAGLGFELPAILVLTTLGLIAAQFEAVGKLRGARTLGLFGVYLFLATIGALCDARALAASGATGLWILAFVCIVLAVHTAVLLPVAALLKADPGVVAVASQANVGGGSSALALARSLGRSDLVLPGILVGSLGSALGTYLGVLVVSALS